MFSHFSSKAQNLSAQRLINWQSSYKKGAEEEEVEIMTPELFFYIDMKYFPTAEYYTNS